MGIYIYIYDAFEVQLFVNHADYFTGEFPLKFSLLAKCL